MLDENRETMRSTEPGLNDRRARMRLARAHARAEESSRRKRWETEFEPAAFADPLFVDPFCALSPR